MAGSTDVVVRFLADTSKIQAATAEVESTGDKLKTWAKGAAAAIGTAFAVDQLRQAIDAAASFADAVSASSAIFDDSAKAVNRWVENNALAFNLSKSQAQDAANTFGVFGKAAGLTGKDLSGFSTDLVGLAGDLRSFYGGNVTDALTAIGGALRGESEPIRKYGVLLDDATLRARAAAMGIASGTEPLTQQQKVLAVNAELWAQTSDAQGDAAKTADSVANQQAKLTAQTENARIALGNALLPVMQQLLPIVTQIAAAFEKYAPILVPLAAVILGIVAAMKLATVAQWAYNAAVGANPIGAIILGIMALIAVIVLIVKHWDDVKAAAQKCWDLILDAVRFVWEWIKANWPLLLAILTGPFGIAVGLIVKYRDDIWNAIKFVWDWIKSNWPLLAAILAGPFGIAVYLIANNWEQIKAGAAHVIDVVVMFFAGLPGRIMSTIGSVGGQIIDHLFNGLESGAKKVLDKIEDIGRKIGSALNPFDSPHRHSWYVGRDMLRDLERGARSIKAPTARAFAAMGRPTIDAYAAGAGRTAHYSIVVNVAAGVSPAEVGARTVDAIRQYERVAGTGWRR